MVELPVEGAALREVREGKRLALVVPDAHGLAPGDVLVLRAPDGGQHRAEVVGVERGGLLAAGTCCASIAPVGGSAGPGPGGREPWVVWMTRREMSSLVAAAGFAHAEGVWAPPAEVEQAGREVAAALGYALPGGWGDLL